MIYKLLRLKVGRFMFGFMKLIGAPPKAYHYYRSTKNSSEKAIIQDLYKEYDDLIRKEEIRYKDFVKSRESYGLASYNSDEEREFILSNAFGRLIEYGDDKGYSEFLISLFYQG